MAKKVVYHPNENVYIRWKKEKRDVKRLIFSGHSFTMSFLIWYAGKASKKYVIYFAGGILLNC